MHDLSIDHKIILSWTGLRFVSVGGIVWFLNHKQFEIECKRLIQKYEKQLTQRKGIQSPIMSVTMDLREFSVFQVQVGKTFATILILQLYIYYKMYIFVYYTEHQILIFAII